ncbi:hypothetical protein LAWI1_G007479 [Lachnellula willkommii]|uniref:Uncharacterized protein n=1 Tax=Lachnellula willkommii TaxID=215461 RepID=A0A559M9J4_9HELO|nr:hypothetical protein LAWI1_G007479 [Lachnellula willkommii]
MDKIREYANYDPRQWMSAEDVQVRWKITDTGSMPRKLVADSLACNHPLHNEDLEAQKLWTKVLQKYPNLSTDIHKAGAKKWNGTQPWDDEHRTSYMIPDTVSLEQRWEDQILAKRSREEVKAAADGGCLKSRLELLHLDRNLDPKLFAVVSTSSASK